MIRTKTKTWRESAMSSSHNPTTGRANGTAARYATDNESPLFIDIVVCFKPLNTSAEGNR